MPIVCEFGEFKTELEARPFSAYGVWLRGYAVSRYDDVHIVLKNYTLCSYV